MILEATTYLFVKERSEAVFRISANSLRADRIGAEQNRAGAKGSAPQCSAPVYKNYIHLKTDDEDSSAFNSCEIIPIFPKVLCSALKPPEWREIC